MAQRAGGLTIPTFVLMVLPFAAPGQSPLRFPESDVAPFSQFETAFLEDMP